MTVKGNKVKLVIVIALIVALCNFLFACGSSPNADTNTNTNTATQTQFPSQPKNNKEKAQYYRMLAEQYYNKAKAEQSHVDFAKKALDDDPSSVSAKMMYDSAVRLQKSYQDKGDKYTQMAIQAEAG